MENKNTQKEEDVDKLIEEVKIKHGEKIETSKEYLQRIGILPADYSVTGIFLISLTFFLILFTNPSFKTDIEKIYPALEILFKFINMAILISILNIIVTAVALYYTYFNKETIPLFWRRVLIAYAIITSIIVSLFAASFAIENTLEISIIFPILNIADIFILWSFFDNNIINESYIINKLARGYEIIIGSVIIFTIFIISQYVFKNYWAITFSICLVYALSLNENVCKRLFGLLKLNSARN